MEKQAPVSEWPRVHAYLARLGFGSRRGIEEQIKKGKVLINGRRASLGDRVNPREDRVKFKDRTIAAGTSKKSTVFVLYKPRGYVTTVKDPEGRATVMDLLPGESRLYPVGRLDLMSEGLLLMTDDGELAHRLMHPQFETPKTYEVKIRGALDEKKIAHLKKGVRVESKKFQGAEVLSVRDATRAGVPKFVVTLKVFEGKNHHVRKMFAALKCRVIRLKRTAMGPVTLKGIARGQYRKLSDSQLKELRKALGLE